MCPKEKLVPGGILEPVSGKSFVFFGTSHKTSDFIVDGNRAGNFFWKGVRTVAQLLDAPYEKGIKVCVKEKTKLEQRLQRSEALRWWDITIHPEKVF